MRSRRGGPQGRHVGIRLCVQRADMVYHVRERIFAKTMERTFYTEAELLAFAGEIARELRRGDVIALSGPLGAGKTAFVRGVVAERLDVDPVSSPTFTFWHRYARDGRIPVDHLDFYRIDNPRDVRELGLEAAFDGDSIVLVEWWERAPELLPPVRWEVDIAGSGDQPRRLAVRRPDTA